MPKKINILFLITILLIIIYITLPVKKSNRENFNNNYKLTPNNDSVLCVIFTSKNSFYERAEAVLDTWAYRCNKSIFATNFKSLFLNKTKNETKILKKFSFLKLSINESYDKMAQKAILVVKLIYEKYSFNYDWFFLADDDTYVFTNNLYKFIRSKNTSKPETFGYNFKKVVRNGYHSGGAGILLTRESLYRLYIGIKNKKCDIIEGYSDVALGECAQNSDVKLSVSTDKFGLERFHPLGPTDHLFNNYPDWLHDYASNKLKGGDLCCSHETISFHYVKPNQMRLLNMLSKIFQ